MKIKKISVLILLFFFVWYILYYYNNIKIKQSYFYYDMIESLKINDVRSARFYAKQILNSYGNTIYKDLAKLFIYNDLKSKCKDKRILQFCEKNIKNENSGLKDVVRECDNFLHKKIK